VWTFPGGATLKMSFLDVDDDASKYQGHQWTWLAFDEAGAWPTSRAIDMLRACLRSPHGVPCRLLLTGNPGGKGHQWLQERFVDPAPPGTPFRGEDGTLRVFIPSKLQDNKILMNADPGYEDRLKASGPSWQVRAWLLGDWDARQEGALLKREWMQPYTLVPDKFERVVMSLDTAFKQGQANDYSVATVWGVTKTGFYLLDLVRAKLEFPALKATVLQLAEKWPPHVVLVEDKASGQSLIQALKQETRLPVLAVKVDADKVSRCNAITPTLEAGRVYVPHKAPWLEAFLDECLMFPFGSHDDQIDSMTQALNYMAAPMANAGIFDYYKRKAEAARGGAA